MTTYGTADAACTAVYTFLSLQSGYDPANPGGQHLQRVLDLRHQPALAGGRWAVAPVHFDATGNITFVPNTTYSGRVKPTLKKFNEVPFTSDTSQFNALAGGKVNVGYLPSQDITASTSTALVAGTNNPRLSNFTLEPLYTWSINFFPYNFDSTGDGGNAGKIFSQLYFRQAVQYLVDQPQYISNLSHGYGVGTYGPVPLEPQNAFVSTTEKGNPYSYSPSKAKGLL